MGKCDCGRGCSALCPGRRVALLRVSSAQRSTAQRSPRRGAVRSNAPRLASQRSAAQHHAGSQASQEHTGSDEASQRKVGVLHSLVHIHVLVHLRRQGWQRAAPVAQGVRLVLRCGLSGKLKARCCSCPSGGKGSSARQAHARGHARRRGRLQVANGCWQMGGVSAAWRNHHWCASAATLCPTHSQSGATCRPAPAQQAGAWTTSQPTQRLPSCARPTHNEGRLAAQLQGDRHHALGARRHDELADLGGAGEGCGAAAGRGQGLAKMCGDSYMPV